MVAQSVCKHPRSSPSASVRETGQGGMPTASPQMLLHGERCPLKLKPGKRETAAEPQYPERSLKPSCLSCTGLFLKEKKSRPGRCLRKPKEGSWPWGRRTSEKVPHSLGLTAAPHECVTTSSCCYHDHDRGTHSRKHTPGLSAPEPF